MGIVSHAFKPSTEEAEAGDILDFKASLVYNMNSGQQETHNKIFSQKKKNQTNKKPFLRPYLDSV